MLSIFRTNQILSSILLLLYLLLLHSASFVEPNIPMTSTSGVFGEWVITELDALPAVWQQILVILILFIQAILLISITLEHRFQPSNNLFAGVFFCLLASMFDDFQALSAPLIANLFFILALSENWRLYKMLKPAGAIFNIGFWIGIASLFYFPAIFLIFWAFFSLPIMRSIEGRHILMLLSGLLTPYLLASTAFFWYDSLDWFLQMQFAENFAFFSFNFSLGTIGILKLAVLGLLVLIAFLSIGTYSFKRDIATQKRISSLYWALFFSLLAGIFQADTELAHFLLAIVPLGLFYSLNFSIFPNRLAESVHLLLVLAALLLNYREFLIPA